jgi:NADH-quinone oxidoreductase subunit N
MTSPEALLVSQRTLAVLAPEIWIILAATVMMTAGAFVRWPRRTWSCLTASVLVVAFGILFFTRGLGTEGHAYGAVALNDALSWYARMGLVLAGFLVLALAHDQVDDRRSAEFFGALLMVHAGAMLVASANELVFLFVGLELVSIPTYLLLYLSRRNETTQEAATKYFFLSIFSSALLVFGMAYLYGIAGVANLKAMAYLVQASPGVMSRWFALIAAVFMVAGLGFRVAAVPFHFYAPDVYQGSPTLITALLAWVPKAVGFLAMVRVLTAVVGGSILSEKAVVLTWVIAVATMFLGNTVALAQNDLKRLLAYSSIAHAGYLMIGVTAALVDPPGANDAYLGVQGIVFYLAAYALMTLGVFGFILALNRPERPVETVDDLRGLAATRPLAAFGLALCLFSLAGVPPLAGFWGKFLVFASALDATTGDRRFILLAVLGAINAAIGAYYYLRIVVAMYLRPVVGEPVQARAGWPTLAAITACAGLSLVLGMFPGPLFRIARESARSASSLPDPLVLSGTVERAVILPPSGR